MSGWKEYRDNALTNDPETRTEYEALESIYSAITDVIRIRREMGLTQAQLAERMGKQQPAIARLEAARTQPSLTLLEEVARALDARLIVRIESKHDARSPLQVP